MPFPVTIFGQTFQESDFLGLNYVQGIPDSLDKLGELNAAAQSWNSVSSATLDGSPLVLTIATGIVDALDNSIEQVVVRAYNSAGNYVDGTVTSYNAVNGELVIEPWYITGAGTYASWTVTVLLRGGTGEEVVLGADAGGTGIYTTTTDARLGFMAPLPGMGYVMQEEFLFGLPNYVPGTNPTSTPWVYRSQQLAALAGPSIANLAGVAQVGYYSGSDASSLSYGPRGFLSVGSPGDLYFGTFVAFSTNVFTGQGSTSYFVGLRGEASSYLFVFDKYGIGFEAILDSTNVRHWYGVVTLGGVSTRTLLLSGAEAAYCVIWVDSFSKIAYLGVAATAAAAPNPGETAVFQMAVDISGWPEADPNSFVHPAASVSPNVAAGAQHHTMYVDRVFLYKALER